MSDVEGVTAEEPTVQDSVENQPEEKVETPATEPDEVEPADEPSQDGEEAEVDWKAKAQELEAKAKELETKTKRQTAANKATQERYEEALAERKKLEQEILALKKPNIDDYDTQEDYDKAQSEYEDKVVDSKAELKAQEIEAQKAQAAQYQQAGEVFREKEQQVIADNPDYQQNVETLTSYLEMLPKDDPGVQSFGKYLTMESEIGPALANHLGKHPEIVEDQLIGKPWPIVKKKLQRIEQELSVPKTPASNPLPKPPTKTKGSATPKIDPKKLDDPDAYMRWRNSQLKK